MLLAYDTRGAIDSLYACLASRSYISSMSGASSPYVSGINRPLGRRADALKTSWGKRPQVKAKPRPQLRESKRKAELTSAHSRVTTRHRPHHYPENQSAAGAASPDVHDGAKQSPGSNTDMKNVARRSSSRGGRVAEACATTARGDGRRRFRGGARAPTATRPAGSPRQTPSPQCQNATATTIT